MKKYTVTATKKDGTTYEGLMTTKEPRVTNGLIAIAQSDGAWIYFHQMKSAALNMCLWLKKQNNQFIKFYKRHS